MTQPWFRAHLPIASHGWKVSKCLGSESQQKQQEWSKPIPSPPEDPEAGVCMLQKTQNQVLVWWPSRFYMLSIKRCCLAQQENQSWQGRSLPRAYANEDSLRLPPTKGRSSHLPLIEAILCSFTWDSPEKLSPLPRATTSSSASFQSLLRREMLGSLRSSFHIPFLFPLFFTNVVNGCK